MAKSSIQIIGIVQIAGNSKKTGNAYDIRNAQCVVRSLRAEGGEPQVLIGVLSLPDRYKDIQPGLYDVDFEASVDQNGRIGSQVHEIFPWGGPESFLHPGRKSIVEVLAVVPLSGFSQKSKKEYDMRLGQCIVHRVNADGVVSDIVGELLLPEKFKDVKPGFYDVEFDVSVGNDKRIGTRVREMTPRGAPTVPAPRPAPVPVAVPAAVIDAAADAADKRSGGHQGRPGK